MRSPRQDANTYLNPFATLSRLGPHLVVVGFKHKYYRRVEFLPISVFGPDFSVDEFPQGLKASAFVEICMKKLHGPRKHWPRDALDYVPAII